MRKLADNAVMAIGLAEDGLIEFGPRNTCVSQFDHADGTFTKKPRSQGTTSFLTGRGSSGICIPAFLARYVHENRDSSLQSLGRCGSASASGAGRI